LTGQILEDFAKSQKSLEESRNEEVKNWLVKFLQDQEENIKNAVWSKSDRTEEYKKIVTDASDKLDQVMNDHLDKTVKLIKKDDPVVRTNFEKLKERLDGISENYLKESRLRDSAIRQMEQR